MAPAAGRAGWGAFTSCFTIEHGLKDAFIKNFGRPGPIPYRVRVVRERDPGRVTPHREPAAPSQWPRRLTLPAVAFAAGWSNP
jgi:hypothetical protein